MGGYLTGWIMLLAYLIVCPWEAVAVGKLAGYLIPSLNSFEIYRIADQPVFLPWLLLGISMTLFLAALNHRGIRASATFQGLATTAVLVFFAIVAIAGVLHGSAGNFHPGFSAAPLVSILLVLQIVPYFMTGFESVPKAADEARKEFPPHGRCNHRPRCGSRSWRLAARSRHRSRLDGLRLRLVRGVYLVFPCGDTCWPPTRRGNRSHRGIASRRHETHPEISRTLFPGR